MASLLSKNILICSLLFFIPSILIVSWTNVYMGNDNYGLDNYLKTFLFPAILFAYGGSLITAEILSKYIKFSLSKILPAFVITFILAYFILNFILIFYGIDFGSGTILLTPQIPVVNADNTLFSPCPAGTDVCGLVLDPIKTARHFYIPYLLFTLTVLIISYKNSNGYLTVTKRYKHRR